MAHHFFCTHKMAAIYPIPGFKTSTRQYTENEMKIICKNLSKEIESSPEFILIKKGDVFTLLSPTDPQYDKWKYVWNGTKLLRFDLSIDPQGSLPKEMKVSDEEFYPHYWRTAIPNNGIFYFNQEILNRMKFQIHTLSGNILTVFHIGSFIWYCYIDYPEPLLRDENLHYIKYIQHHKDAYFDTQKTHFIGNTYSDRTIFLKFKNPI